MSTETKPAKQSLFGIRDDFDTLFWMAEEAAHNSESGEVDEETQAQLDEFYKDLVDNFESKADSYAYVMAAEKSKVDAIKREVKRLQALSKGYQNKVERMKKMLFDGMVYLKMDVLVTELHRFSIANVGGKRVMEITCDVKDIPNLYVDEVTTLVPDKAALYEALEDGEEFDGITLKPHGKTLRIK